MTTGERATPLGVDLGKDISFKVALISFVIVMVDGYDALMIAFIAPLLAHEWGLKPTDIGKIFAVGYVGAIVGAIAMGPMADRVGRKPMLLAALALAAVATALCALATTPEMLMGLRFVTGIALGGALPAVASLTAEHAKPAKRNGTVTLMYIGYPMGAVVGGAVTAGLLHLGWSNIFLGAGAACVVALGVALLMPESFKRQADGAASEPLLKKVSATFTEQFAEGRLWPALTLWLGLFCMLLLTYFLVSWTPSILVANGGSPRVAALGGVLLNLGGIVGAVVMAPLINRFGPYIPVATIVVVGAGFVALLGQNLGSVPMTMLVLFVAGACVIGGQLNFPAMTVELFPPHVRGAGSGWTIGVGRIGSIVGPLAGGALIAAQLGADKLFLIAAVPALAAGGALLAAAKLRPRT
jgi:AAHS family 4-hydroxybenzoate transporter-like MFS transporter